MPDNVSRKDFVALIGTAVAVETLPAGVSAEAATPHHTVPVPSLESEPEAYTFFTAPESAFVEAAVERLIPTDELGPGGREAGVAFYIDQQLSGQFGWGAFEFRLEPADFAEVERIVADEVHDPVGPEFMAPPETRS